MKSLFDSASNVEIVSRIKTLSPDSKASWGKMTVDQMLVHAQVPLKVAFGELRLKRSLPGILFGAIAKKQLTSDTPFKKNLPTDKKFIVTGRHNFERESETLVALVQRFGKAGPQGISQQPHPFFGKLQPQEWDILMWKHLDHHLRQFGV